MVQKGSEGFWIVQEGSSGFLRVLEGSWVREGSQRTLGESGEPQGRRWGVPDDPERTPPAKSMKNHWFY